MYFSTCLFTSNLIVCCVAQFLIIKIRISFRKEIQYCGRHYGSHCLLEIPTVDQILTLIMFLIDLFERIFLKITNQGFGGFFLLVLHIYIKCT